MRESRKKKTSTIKKTRIKVGEKGNEDKNKHKTAHSQHYEICGILNVLMVVARYAQ